MNNTSENKDEKTAYFRTIIRGFLGVPIYLGIMFLLAGRTTYWQAWVYSGYTLISAIFSIYFFRERKDLALERMKPGPGVRKIDRIFFSLNSIVFMINIMIASLDGGRHHWSGPIPPVLYLAAAVFFLFSLVLFYWSMSANRFFSSMVRIQEERGHQLIQDGPYRYVRHPGYLGGIFFGPATAILLGSFWALIPGMISSIMLLIRSHYEDKMLREKLPGYVDYSKRVRYRILPGLW
ncbi:methyltransferase family protein [Acidobacteriota bacterium]